MIIAVIGEKPYSEGWGDRESLDLSKEDKKILKRVNEKNLPYLIILISGRPMLIEDEIKDCDAFIAVWLPGTEGAGIADVIFGDYKPTGKLSMSWPKSMKQIPINIGDKDYDPLFSFGYGLTY
jgi:beta-glucosidase